MIPKHGESCNNCCNMGKAICDFFWIDANEICESYKQKEEDYGKRICKEVLQKQSVERL